MLGNTQISHREYTFTTLTGGPTGLIHYSTVCHSCLPPCSSDQPTPAFSLKQLLLLAEAETPPPPPLFFSFTCIKPHSLCSSIVCISLYFIPVPF
uniref:Uncharacterized protein n=1 Tax=Piliocolobus tephrosceles TaxID=591936 RepID=A0A8C9HG67_9PRIM